MTRAAAPVRPPFLDFAGSRLAAAAFVAFVTTFFDVPFFLAPTGIFAFAVVRPFAPVFTVTFVPGRFFIATFFLTTATFFFVPAGFRGIAAFLVAAPAFLATAADFLFAPVFLVVGVTFFAAAAFFVTGDAFFATSAFFGTGDAFFATTAFFAPRDGLFVATAFFVATTFFATRDAFAVATLGLVPRDAFAGVALPFASPDVAVAFRASCPVALLPSAGLRSAAGLLGVSAFLAGEALGFGTVLAASAAAVGAAFAGLRPRGLRSAAAPTAGRDSASLATPDDGRLGAPAPFIPPCLFIATLRDSSSCAGTSLR